MQVALEEPDQCRRVVLPQSNREHISISLSGGIRYFDLSSYIQKLMEGIILLQITRNVIFVTAAETFPFKE